jgi:hypothetical protein
VLHWLTENYSLIQPLGSSLANEFKQSQEWIWMFGAHGSGTGEDMGGGKFDLAINQAGGFNATISE